jgi:hypothetical protein
MEAHLELAEVVAARDISVLLPYPDLPGIRARTHRRTDREPQFPRMKRNRGVRRVYPDPDLFIAAAE